MTKRMLLDATNAEETRVVVLDGNRLEDYDVETSTKLQLKGRLESHHRIGSAHQCGEVRCWQSMMNPGTPSSIVQQKCRDNFRCSITQPGTDLQLKQGLRYRVWLDALWPRLPRPLCHTSRVFSY